MIEIMTAKEWCTCCQKQTNTKRIKFSQDGRQGMSVVLCDDCRKELIKALGENSKAGYWIYDNKTMRPIDTIKRFKELSIKNKQNNGLSLTDVEEYIQSKKYIQENIIQAIEGGYELFYQQNLKTEHWIDNHNGTISCSGCYTWFRKDGRNEHLFNICPYCGTKMSKEESEE